MPVRLRQTLKLLGLLLLLIAAQHGAVVHELGHVSDIDSSELKIASGTVETTCVLCPAFAQVVTPTFSHSFQLPLLVRAAPELSAEPLYIAADEAVPAPRSRGPPV